MWIVNIYDVTLFYIALNIPVLTVCTVQVNQYESYREQSRRLLMLSNCSRAYFGVFFDWCAMTQTNEQTRVYICIALIVPCRSHLLTCSAMIGRLCIIHVISQTTLDVLGNINSTYGRVPSYRVCDVTAGSSVSGIFL